MEDLLILILQGLVQVILELFAYWPWDCWWDDRPYTGADDEKMPLFGWMLFSIILGGIMGSLSLCIFPDVLIRLGWVRVALLIISPLSSAFLAYAMAKIRSEKNELVNPKSHFWISLCFSVGFVWVRFAFAHRPG